MRVSIDKAGKHRFPRQRDNINGKVSAGALDISVLADEKALSTCKGTLGVDQFRTIQCAHERRACCTMSTSIFLVSAGVLTSPGNAMRAPFMPSSVFMRT